MNTIIRKIRPEEYSLLREFLYQAIYLPEGVEPPPRSGSGSAGAAGLYCGL